LKRIPFVVQLSLIVFVILIIPLIIIMSYIGYTTLRYTKDEIAQNALQNIELSRRVTENFIDNISASVHRVAIFHDFYVYDGLQRYSSIQGNAENILKIERLQRELQSIVRGNDAVISVFFIFDEGDYVISTDRGIAEILDYPNLAWMRSVSTQRRGFSGSWVARNYQVATIRETMLGIDSWYNIPVISYIYSINRLTTAIKGTIVANVRESSIAANLNTDRLRSRSNEVNNDENSVILVQQDGIIISHPHEENFIIQGRNLPYIAGILDCDDQKGFKFFEEGSRQYLYTWYKAEFFNWVYISVQSINNLLHRSTLMIRTMTIISLIIVFFGMFISLLLFLRISRPMRQIIKTLRDNAFVNEKAARNEFDFLFSAFTKIESKEKELRGLLNEREKDAVIPAMRNLLTGDSVNEQDMKNLERIFPYKYFTVACAALDNYDEYNRKISAEERAYHRYLFISKAEEAAASLFAIRGFRLINSQIAFIINYPQEDDLKQELIPFFSSIKNHAKQIFKRTLTIGVSETGFNMESLQQCARQASEAVTMRMLRGSGNIIFWSYYESSKRFFYPENREARILNYLTAGNLDLIKSELDEIQRNIRQTENITYDNICFIYNQLAGVTIKRLSEVNIQTSVFLLIHGNIYKSIASCETLEQLNLLMIGFYGNIINYLHKEQESEKPIDRIMACFKNHFRDDMFFEDMASELGMSYSYMRKIVKNDTGKSVNETINYLRIQEAKALLLDDKLTLDDVAKSVGYRNNQSLKRFFKKYEGLNPTNYRLIKFVNKTN